MYRFLLVAIGVLMLSAPANALAEETRQNDHDALKALLKTTQEAFNTENFELIRPLVAKNGFIVVTIDGNKFQTLDAFRNYWNDVLKKNKTGLQRIEVNPVADGPTEFLAENVGVCHGTSNDRYVFTNGNIKTMPERWTAVMLKEGGAWKLSKIVFSANIMDNPVLTTTKDMMQRFIVWAALAGLLIGAAAMWLISGRKTA